MSLLNQVLKDLEKRPEPSKEIAYNSDQIKPVNSKKTSGYIILILIISLILLLVTGFVLFKKNPSKKLQQKPTTNPPPPAAIIQPKVEAANIPDNPPSIQVIEKKVPTKPLKKPSVNPEKKSNHHFVNLEKTQKKPINALKTKPKTLKKVKKAKPTLKKPDNISSANQLFKSVQSQSNTPKNIETLGKVLQRDPAHHEARVLLANHLTQSGRVEEAKIILNQGLAIQPSNHHFIYPLSQLHLKQKQPQNALNLLKNTTTDHDRDEIKLSLLAAAYQQNNDNTQAAKMYSKLSRLYPQKAEYWLGLGISLEKVGHNKHAINAFKQALSKKTLDSSIVNYINNRIRSLR